jgi:hypothetical protein
MNAKKDKVIYKLGRKVGLKQPLDGYTPEERWLERLLAKNTIETLYAKLPTERMKFIVAARFELDYTEQMIASILGVSQPSLRDEIDIIRGVFLGRNHQPMKSKERKRIEDVIKILEHLGYSDIPINHGENKVT